MVKTYYELTKPGLVWGNLITTLAGFLFASRFHPAVLILFATLAGTALVIASACVFNNIFDREADAKMPRTKNRALVAGTISEGGARIFATILLIGGFAILFLAVGVLPCFIAFLGTFVYVGLYTPFKYHSPFAVFVGSISGACPILIGYTAASGRLDLAALILFTILVMWQMPHFYAIALFRRADYAAAGIPVISMRKGERAVYRHMLTFIVLYIIAAVSLTYLGLAGIIYLVVVAVSGGLWFGVALNGWKQPDSPSNARRIFFMSLAVMLSFVVALSFAPILP